FSSRRRHTRWPRDWSSDVCSSDLGAIEYLRSGPQNPFLIYLPLGFPHCPYHAPQPFHDLIDPDSLPPLRPADLPGKPDFHRLIRSEERRVGKEPPPPPPPPPPHPP